METTAYIIAYNLRHLRQVVFEVTDACNLQCEYCAYSDLYEGYDKRENLKLLFRQAQLIIDYLYQYWSQRIPKGTNHPVTISFYGGEPTLNVALIKQVIDYVESLRRTGRVSSVSPVPTAESMYVVDIELPNGLRTNYEKELPITRELKGSAEIITEDLRLIERLLAPLKKFKNSEW